MSCHGVPQAQAGHTFIYIVYTLYTIDTYICIHRYYVYISF